MGLQSVYSLLTRDSSIGKVRTIAGGIHRVLDVYGGCSGEAESEQKGAAIYSKYLAGGLLKYPSINGLFGSIGNQGLQAAFGLADAMLGRSASRTDA